MLRSWLHQLKRLTRSETQMRDDLLIRFLKFVPTRVTPNIITVVRLALSVVLFLPRMIEATTALLVVALGAAGDAADGVLARKRDRVTMFGKFLDPLADKILAVGVLYYLYTHAVIGLSLIVHVILPDLLYLVYVLGYLFSREKAPAPDPSVVGRVKVVCYFAGFAVMLIAHSSGKMLLHDIGIALVITGIALAWVAHVFYAYEAIRRSAADRRNQLQ